MNKKGVILALIIGLGLGWFLAGATDKPVIRVSAEKPVFVEVEPVIVNLSSKKHYLKATMQIEMARPEMTNEVNNRMPQIKDAAMIVLSSKSAEDLLTIEGKFRLKEQVLTRINNLLPSGLVKNVFFTEFVIHHDDCFMTIDEAEERIQNGSSKESDFSTSAPEESERNLLQDANPHEPSRGKPYD